MMLAQGKEVARDLVAARADLASAAQKGELAAARVYSAFLAAGIGGPRDWRAALQFVRKWATRDPVSAREARLIAAMNLDEAGNPIEPPVVEPRHPAKPVGVVRGFMTPAECDFLVEIAQQRFRPAMINRGGIMVKDPVRTNETASLSFDVETPFVNAINRRIAAATGTDVAQGEALNLLRYRPGQEYKLHCDAAPGEANQRILTALVYLNQGYGGGETIFPQLGFEFRGEAGDLLVFGNTATGGDRDVDMIHAGLPVRSGVKLIASRWIRQRPPFEATMGGEDAYGGTL